jgi:hypothetical protein
VTEPWQPFKKPRPRFEPASGETIWTRVSDHIIWSCELRFRGEDYGWEARLLRSGDFFAHTGECAAMLTVRRLLLWLPPLLYMALIFYLSSQSNPLPSLTTRIWDKGLHTVEYGVLGLLVCRAALGEVSRRRKPS